MGGFKVLTYLILQARPTGDEPAWWPRDDAGEKAWVTVDKDDGASWSLGEHYSDSHLVPAADRQHIDWMAQEWLEEHGEDASWEFATIEVRGRRMGVGPTRKVEGSTESAPNMS